MITERAIGDEQEIQDLTLGVEAFKTQITKEFLYLKRKELHRALQGSFQEIEDVLIIRREYDHECFDSLYITMEGEWSTGDGVHADQSIENVLEDFAVILNPEFQAIDNEFWEKVSGCKNLKGRRNSKCYEDLKKLYDPKKQKFVQDHKLELLRGFTVVLAKTLFNLTSNQ